MREFDESCVYEDTQYAGAFEGKARIRAHLDRVADALPPTFQFCIDEVADGGTKVGVQWHVENEGVALPFTRGCSMYTCDLETGRLLSGFDVPEPAPFKPGGASLTLLSVASKLIAQPARARPRPLNMPRSLTNGGGAGAGAASSVMGRVHVHRVLLQRHPTWPRRDAARPSHVGRGRLPRDIMIDSLPIRPPDNAWPNAVEIY